MLEGPSTFAVGTIHPAASARWGSSRRTTAWCLPTSGTRKWNALVSPRAAGPLGGKWTAAERTGVAAEVSACVDAGGATPPPRYASPLHAGAT